MLVSMRPGIRSLLPLSLATLTACAAHRDGPSPSRPDCSIDAVPHVANDGSTLLYAMTDLSIDESDLTNHAHTGFDLDGLVSGDHDLEGCFYADYFSALDPEQNCASVEHQHCALFSPLCNCALFDGNGEHSGCLGAVDNQFPLIARAFTEGFVQIDLRGAAHSAAASGRLVVLMQLTGVDAFDNDTDVHVRLFRGFASLHTACTTPTPGATYQIDRASLRANGSTPDDSTVDLTGAIRNGRLRVTGTDQMAFALRWPLQPDAGLASIEVPLRHIVFAMDVAHDAATRGNFGAWVTGDDLADAILAVAPQIGSNTARGMVAPWVDLQRDGVCDDETSMPSRLGAISLGFGFSAVRVQLDPMNPVVDAPAPGSCSFVAAIDAGRD